MRKSLLLAVCCVLMGCGGSGDGPAETLSGTAATGAAIPNAAVVIKDSTGSSVSTTTNAQGQYSANVGGMTPPFVGQVALPGGGELFSIATETGTANIDPLSDLMADAFFAVRGTTPENVFPTLDASTDLPNEVEVQALEGIVERMVQPWLVAAGVDPATFDIVTTPFVANGQGYDQVLGYTTITAGQLAGTTSVVVATVNITDGTTTQDSTFTADAAGNLVVDTTTTGPGGTSTIQDSTAIPPTSAAQAAELGVLATIGGFRATVNARGAALTAADLLPYTTTDLLDNGMDRTFFTADVATFLRGVTIDTFTVARIHGYDETNDILDVTLFLAVSQGALSESEEFRFPFRGVGSAHLMYGNQRVAEVDESSVQFERRTDSFTSGDTTGTSINVHVNAPVDTVTSVTVTGPGGFSDTLLTKSPTTNTDILEPTPTTTLPFVTDSFYVNSGPITLPSVPATYTITLNLNPTGTQVYTVTTTGSAGEQIQYTVSPTTRSAAAIKGQTVTVTWTLPTTYALSEVDLSGNMTDGVTTINIEPDSIVGVTSTSATLTFTPPAGTPNPATFSPLNLNLSFTGANGQRSLLIYAFDQP
ncbi:MAG: hypothetical protein L6Q95_01385 [Planctomycetes bacterium]|nr:hypothetical protein [Planctomycetota bacterium]